MLNSQLIDRLRCPSCGERLRQTSDSELRCSVCATSFEVRDDVPRFVRDSTATAKYFGYIWGLHTSTVAPPAAPALYHLHVMREALGAPPFAGLILDGGCGDGVDLALLALDPACEIIGVELSAGGAATSRARIQGLTRAQVVQADLLRLPMATGIFDGAYSYGVVHHTPDPPRAVREIARTLKPGASLLLYVYEDFSDRRWTWRAALWLANTARHVTTRLPPPVLMAVCRMLSPVVYTLCTLPSRWFRWAARFPYRHNTHAWSLVGDLYDRLSAPIEIRYSERGAAALAGEAGLDVVRTAQRRGWMVWARKPAVQVR